jgi:predicted acyl esterase
MLRLLQLSLSRFHPASYAQVPAKQQTDHSAFELPTPAYWTSHNYIVVRIDEIGTGQSPGRLNVFSPTILHAYPRVIEWASNQPWSTGKVGLLGISYYAVTQWYAAAQQPKGLAAIVPWEGFSDLYRDFVRHGGILSNNFFDVWWPRQVKSNQYGRPGKAAKNWGPDTIEGTLTSQELDDNLVDTPEKVVEARFADDPMFASMNINYADITIPFLSVGNLGGTGLHLRGNVFAFMHAASKFKYLRFISGRHDLPFFLDEEVELQRSFLDAFLHGNDTAGWSEEGKLPAVSLLLRKGNPGFNDIAAEAACFARRSESEWPLARTQYTKLYLTPDRQLSFEKPLALTRKLSYTALHSGDTAGSVTFSSPAFTVETEITGHIVLHVFVSVSGVAESECPSDIDIFVALHHFQGEHEIFYTGTTGQPIPVTNGHLRVSHRKVNSSHRYHNSFQPYRSYTSFDVQPVLPNEIYEVDIEIMPTNVVVGKGNRLVLEVGSRDTEHTDVFKHNHPTDRYDYKDTSTPLTTYHSPDY